MKTVVTELETFQYFYPYTVALVGARWKERTNFMSCAWHSALSFKPPLFGVLIAGKRHTHGLITEAKEFTVNFLRYDQAKLSAHMGRTSGRDLDKVSRYNLRLAPARFIGSPLVAESYAALECRLVKTHALGDHDLFVGEVMAVHHDPDAFHAEGVLDAHKVAPLLYLGSDRYITVRPETTVHVLPD